MLSRQRKPLPGSTVFEGAARTRRSTRDRLMEAVVSLPSGLLAMVAESAVNDKVQRFLTPPCVSWLVRAS